MISGSADVRLKVTTMWKKLKLFVLCLIPASRRTRHAGPRPKACFAVIDTSKGVMRVELNHRAAPTTVANFANLAMRGFYDGLTFHRVERNFMAPGRRPARKRAWAAQAIASPASLILKHNQPGIISMANSGPGTDGSQFFPDAPGPRRISTDCIRFSGVSLKACNLCGKSNGAT